MKNNKKNKNKKQNKKIVFLKQQLCTRTIYKERTPAETRQVIICFSWHDSGHKRSRYHWGPLVSTFVIHKLIIVNFIYNIYISIIWTI